MLILFDEKPCFSSGLWSSRGHYKVDVKGHNDFSLFFRSSPFTFRNENFSWKTRVIWASDLRLLQRVSNFSASLQKWSVIRTTFQVLVWPAVVYANKSHNSFLCCFASYLATLVEGWNNFRPTSLLNCRSLFLMIYMFIHVKIQTEEWFCRGFDCQIPTAKDWKDTEPGYISETIRNILK